MPILAISNFVPPRNDTLNPSKIRKALGWGVGIVLQARIGGSDMPHPKAKQSNDGYTTCMIGAVLPDLDPHKIPLSPQFLDLIEHQKTEGSVELNNGVKLRGFFQKDTNDLLGFGFRTLSHGVEEIGVFTAGRFQSGVVRYPDGMQSIGPRSNSRLHGEGIRIHPNRTLERGRFENNTLIRAAAPFKQGPHIENSKSFEKSIGVLNANGDLQGVGALFFIDAQGRPVGLFGIFDDGYIQNGVSVYPNGGRDIGSRKNGKLEGLYCRRVWANSAVDFGVFEAGECVQPEQPFDSASKKNAYLQKRGVQLLRNGDITQIGTFRNWQLDGRGLKLFSGGPEHGGIAEEGVYQDGIFISGTVTFPYGEEIQYGPRVQTDDGMALEVPECIHVVVHDRILRGRFVGNELIEGTIDYGDGTYEAGTFSNNALDGPDGLRLLPNGEALIGSFENGRPEGHVTRLFPDGGSRFEFYLNGILVSAGEFSNLYLSENCYEIFNTAKTPFLQDLEMTTQFSHVMRDYDVVAETAFVRYQNALPVRAEKGRSQLESILGKDLRFAGPAEIVADLEICSASVAKLSVSLQKEVTYFLAQVKLTTEGGAMATRQAVSSLELKNWLQEDPSVMTGLRTMNRGKPPFGRNDVLEKAVFYTFLENVLPLIKGYMPNIDIVAFLDYSNLELSASYIINLDQFGRLYQHLYDQVETVSPESYLRMERDGTYHTLQGHAMRLPQPVITRFEKGLYDHERVLYMVPDTLLYFRVPVDPVETNFSELFYWSFCVSEAMRAVSQN